MRKIELTKGKYALVDDLDYEWLNQWKWYYDSHGYAAHGFKANGKTKIMRMHTLIIYTPKGFEVDHSNQNRLDNQKKNLRIATKSQNAMNRKAGIINTSGYKGVSFSKQFNKWTARIKVEQKSIFLGHHKSPEEAALAYNQAARKHHGQFARLNQL